MSARGKLPVLTGNEGALIRSQPFLDGTIKAYYCPGQMPSGSISMSPTGYIKPLTWRKSGALLRPPQQVWIGSNLTVGLNASWASSWLFLEVMDQVRSKVLSLRGDSTWVNTTDYRYDSVHHTGYAPGLAPYNYKNINTDLFPIDWPPDPSFPFVSYGYLPPDYLQWMISPEPSESFFGTDFLYIFIVSDYPEFPYSSPGNHRYLSLPYLHCVDRIQGSYSRFAGYSVGIYVVDNGNQAPWDGFANSPNYYPNLDYFSLVSDDLSKYGYTCSGFQDPSALTADYFVSVIADHFNFDPDTGQDL